MAEVLVAAKLGSFRVHVTLRTSRSTCSHACAISSSLCVLFSSSSCSSLVCFCTAFFFLSSPSRFSSSPSSVVVLLVFRLVCFFDRVKRPFFFAGGLPAESEKHVTRSTVRCYIVATQVQGTGPGAMGPDMLHRNVHTDPSQGQEPDPLSLIVPVVPFPVPVPVLVPCSVNKL